MNFFFAVLLVIVAVIPVEAQGILVKEENLPDYKSCTVWMRSAEPEWMRDPSYGALTSTIYRCGEDISVIEFKREGNEKPFAVDWTKTVERDASGAISKQIRRIYNLQEGGVYLLYEYELDWDGKEKR